MQTFKHTNSQTSCNNYLVTITCNRRTTHAVLARHVSRNTGFIHIVMNSNQDFNSKLPKFTGAKDFIA